MAQKRNWTLAMRTNLRGILARLYPTEGKIRMALSDAGLAPEKVTFVGSAEEVWFGALNELQNRGMLDEFVDLVCGEYSGNEELRVFAQQPSAPVSVPSPVVQTSPSSAGDKLERFVDRTYFDAALWRQRMAEIEGYICRVEYEARPQATGFLIGPNVVLTVYHAVESILRSRKSPTDLTLRFDFKSSVPDETPQGKTYGLASDWLIDHAPYSTSDLLDEGPQEPRPDELNYALLRMADRVGEAPCSNPTDPNAPPRGWLKLIEPPAMPESGDPLLILQHIEGRPVKLAVNAVLGMNTTQTRIRYRTRTGPGSSGAPCFDNAWNLVALHHRSDASMQQRYKEGIPIGAIRRLLQERGKLHLIDG